MPRPEQEQTVKLLKGKGVQLFPAQGMQQAGIPGAQPGGQGLNILDLLQGGASRVGDVLTNIISQTPLAPLVAPQQLTAEDGVRFKQALQTINDSNEEISKRAQRTISDYMGRMSPQELQVVLPYVQRAQQAGPKTLERFGGLVPERPLEGLGQTAVKEPPLVDRPAGSAKFDPKQDLWKRLLDKYENDVEAAYPEYQQMISGKAPRGRGTQPKYSLEEAQISRRLRGQPTGEPEKPVSAENQLFKSLIDKYGGNVETAYKEYKKLKAQPAKLATLNAEQREREYKRGLDKFSLKAYFAGKFSQNFEKDESDEDYNNFLEAKVEEFRNETKETLDLGPGASVESTLMEAVPPQSTLKQRSPTQQAIPQAQAAPPGPGSQPINQLPTGAEQIGMYQGKPLYRTPEGRQFLGQ